MRDNNEREDLHRIAADIGYLKRAVERASPVMAKAGASRGMAWLSLVTGVLILLVAAIYYVLITRFGALALVPAGIKTAMLAFIGAMVVLIGIFKQRMILSTARKIDPSMTIGRVWRELYSYKLIHIYAPLSVMTVGVSIYAWQIGHSELVIPIVSIGLGFMFNAVASILRIPEMLAGGYWFLCSGAIALGFRSAAGPLSVGYTIGMGMIVFAATAFAANRRAK
jgi:hypothetical protein